VASCCNSNVFSFGFHQCDYSHDKMTLCSDKTSFNKEFVTQLEQWIDEYQLQLPPLKNFILPVCFHPSSDLHISSSSAVSGDGP